MSNLNDPRQFLAVHKTCVWVLVAVLQLFPNSALHNIARCAFVEGM